MCFYFYYRHWKASLFCRSIFFYPRHSYISFLLSIIKMWKDQSLFAAYHLWISPVFIMLPHPKGKMLRLHTAHLLYYNAGCDKNVHCGKSEDWLFARSFVRGQLIKMKIEAKLFCNFLIILDHEWKFVSVSKEVVLSLANPFFVYVVGIVLW